MRAAGPIAYGLTAVLFWSTVASAFKLTLRLVEPGELLLWSSAASTLVLGLVVTIRGGAGAVWHASRRDWGRSAALGLLNPFLYYLVLFQAYDRLPGQEAQPLNYTWGIVLPLLSVPLLKQRIRPAVFLAILVSFAGVVVIATRGDLASFRLTDPLGVSLAVGSSLFWSLYWIFNLRDPREESVKLFGNFVFGTLYVLVFLGATGSLRPPSLAGLLGCLYIGLFEMGLTFVVWLKALSLARSTAQVANLIFLAPFLSLVLLHHVAGERISPSSGIGLTLIIGGILLQRRVERKRPR
ncbi:MAG: EamA family transporter [Candidatus Eisenbacteria bacterium]|nr:EamA family transporter [Candidatus Latescibacterota bacterium]MBD3303342.1 EamA family transporter [Candidatus Eisenbacteria bacterium]